MALSIPDVGTPDFRLFLSSGEIASAVKADIRFVEVAEEQNLPSKLSFSLNIWDGFRQQFKNEYFDTFQIGTAVELFIWRNEAEKTKISSGTEDEKRELKIFSGEVSAYEASYGGEDGGDTLKIEALDRLHRLRFGINEQPFANMTDSNIAAKIAEKYEFKHEVEDSKTKHGHVRQGNKKDLEFLLERAKPIDYEVSVEDRTLRFHSRKTLGDKPPVVTLTYRKDLIRFVPRLRMLGESGRVEVRGWDVGNKKPIIGIAGGEKTSGAGGGGRQPAAPRRISDQTVADVDEARKIAEAYATWQQRNCLIAEGECPGAQIVRVGKTVEIAAVPEPFGGVYYVTAVTHTLGSEGFRTRFRGEWVRAARL